MNIHSVAATIVGQNPFIEYHGHTLVLFPELVVIALFTALFFVKDTDWKAATKLPEMITLGLVLFILGGLIGSLLSNNIVYGLSIFKSWFFFPGVLFLILMSSRTIRKYTLYLASAVALCAIITLPKGNSSYSFATRVQSVQIGAKIASEQPLTGIGINSFPTRYQDSAVSVLGKVPLQWGLSLPYNFFMAVWLYGGILGIVGLLLVLFEFLKPPYSVASLPILVLFAVGLVSVPYYSTPLVYLFWLVLAYSVAEGLQKRQTSFVSSAK